MITSTRFYPTHWLMVEHIRPFVKSLEQVEHQHTSEVA